jgi:PiT family inorganic phosphate transporter
MTSTLVFIYFVIVLAFIFDFINGFHDAANSIAIMVATKVLKPLTAVLWAAFFNFIAFLFFHLSVATTIGSGLIEPHIITPYVLFAALMGAIIWNLLTWYFGLPSSSSHGLIGGLVGAAIVAGGWHVLNWHGLLPVLIAIVVSPLLGLSISWLLIKLTNVFLKDINSDRTQRWAKRAQFLAGALLSLGHGGNDAQKTMGIIAVLLFSTGLLNGHFYVPFWVIISCNFVMGLGTLIGGWRIVHTLGNKITQLTPLSGGCAATGAALTLFVATDLGIPVSTTHTVTGAILGVGSTNGWLNTHWPTIRRIMWAWALTIPAAGLVASFVMVIGVPLKLKFGFH